MLYLRDYQTRPKKLSDYLSWAAMPFDNHKHVMAQKDGSYLCCIRFRGPDMDSLTVEQIDLFYAQMNDILMRLEDEQGSAWAQQWDMTRHETDEYPLAEWTNMGSYLFDMERMGHAKKLGAQFESEWTLTLTFLPSSDRMTLIESFLEDSDPNETPETKQRERSASSLEYFVHKVDEIADLMQSRMGKANVKFLFGGELITYLHAPATLRRHRVDLPEVPMFLDCMIAHREIWPGSKLGLGYEEDENGEAQPEDFICMVGIKGWPKTTQGGILDRLNSLNIEYRWVTRAIPLSRQTSIETVTEIMDRWASQRKGIKSIIAEHIFRIPVDRENASAVANHIDAKAALEEVASGHVKMAYVTPTVTVWGKTYKEAKKKATAIISILNGAEFSCHLEKFNAFEAWLGSLPGQCYQNVRQAPISSLNLAHISPLPGVWAGYKWVDKLNAEPLMRCFTNGSTPFRLSFYHGDVGHMDMRGPNGAGKSVMLSSIVYQFFRYKNARVFAFDKDRSIRACTLFCGGKFHEIGSRETGKGIGFQPLAGISDVDERMWSRDWLIDIYTSQGIKLTVADKTRILELLESLAAGPAHERNLTIFRARMTGDLKEALNDYVIKGGAYGHILDADFNELTPHHFHAFEMGAIMKSKALVPVLTYLFHWIDGQIRQRQTEAPPTLIILDESWTYLANTLFAEQLKEWLKTVRKFNVSVIFATQSLGDTTGSAIEDAAKDNCFTTVYLPNPSAMEPASYAKYAARGLNPRQIQNIANGNLKRDYYYVSAVGTRMFELGLGDLGVALAGSSDTRDHLILDAAIAQFGIENVVPAFLVAKGLEWAADLAQPGASDLYPDANILLGEEALAA